MLWQSRRKLAQRASMATLPANQKTVGWNELVLALELLDAVKDRHGASHDTLLVNATVYLFCEILHHWGQPALQRQVEQIWTHGHGIMERAVVEKGFK